MLSCFQDQCTNPNAEILQKLNKIPYKRCARDKPDDRTATSRRERCQSLYDRLKPVSRLDFLHPFSPGERRKRGALLLYTEQNYHVVRTRWGVFRLDEGAYRDFLAGKLWISWDPSRPSAPGSQTVKPDETDIWLYHRKRSHCAKEQSRMPMSISGHGFRA